MAAVAVDRHQSATAWPAQQPQFNARTRFQPGPPTYIPQSESPTPPHNDVELSRDMLIDILEYFSQLVAQLFTGRTIRMVVHGGACMLLHPGLYSLSQQQQQMIPSLPRRTTTRDVDYIHRSFVTELASFGMPDAAVKLQECIKATARYFKLGADWMNSHADIALPMAHDPSGKVYDPIYEASIKQNNIDLHTIFRSNNGMLTLISVTPFWAVSLKLVRYTRWDPGDICLLLRNGMVLSGTVWTPETVEDWLFRNCWPMGYHNFDSRKKSDMRARILHAIELLSKWSSAVKPPEKTISAHDAMGGGDVMGGGEFGGNNGWSYSFGKWPNQVQQQQPQQQQQQQPQQPQQQQAQPSSVQFPMPTPTPVAGPVNVRDWVKDPTRSPSPLPQSRRSSTGNRQDIFIPPDNDWINPNHPPISFRPRSRNPTPDPAEWFHSAESSNSFPPSGPRVPRADPYSLESFDRSINSMLHQSHHRNANLAAAIPSNTQRVIPVGLTRKQNEIRRKKERERERQSKWIPLSGRRDSDVSDSSDEEEEPSRRMLTWYPTPATAQQPPQLRIPAPPTSIPMHSQSRQDHHLPHPSLTSGPVPVSVPPPQMPVPPPQMSISPRQMSAPPNHMHIGLHSPPQSFGPAQLAHYQFEQQHKVYQFQKQQEHHHHHQQQQQQQQQYQQQHQQQQQQYHHPPPQHSQQQSWHNASVTTFR